MRGRLFLWSLARAAQDPAFSQRRLNAPPQDALNETDCGKLSNIKCAHQRELIVGPTGAK